MATAVQLSKEGHLCLLFYGIGSNLKRWQFWKFRWSGVPACTDSWSGLPQVCLRSAPGLKDPSPSLCCMMSWQDAIGSLHLCLTFNWLVLSFNVHGCNCWMFWWFFPWQIIYVSIRFSTKVKWLGLGLEMLKCSSHLLLKLLMIQC